jgi:predicted PurR-regulated permease PerM
MVEAAHSRSESSSAQPSAERPNDDARLGPPTPRVALVLFTAAVVAFLLWLGRDALGPFVIGLLLAYLLDPAVERLGRVGLSRAVSILLVYAAFVIGVVVILYLTVPPLLQQIGQFFGDTPKLSALIQDTIAKVRQAYESLDIPPDIRAAMDRLLATFGQEASVNPGVVVPVFNSVAGFVASTFGFLVIPVWIFYLLKDRPSLTHAFDESLPAEWRRDTWAVIRIAERVFGQWVRGQLVLGTTVAVATFIGLEILGVFVDPVFSQFALFLAILAGLLELLPIIGPIIAAVPLVLLGATASVQAALAALLLAIAIQQLENYFLVPKIQGDAVRMHPSAVMFCLIVGAAIGGLLGAILALPLAATGRDIYRYLFRRLSPRAESQPAAAESMQAWPEWEDIVERDHRSAGGSSAPPATRSDSTPPAAPPARPTTPGTATPASSASNRPAAGAKP